MATKTATASNLSLSSSWTGNGTPSTARQTITFDISSILTVYTINSVTLYCDLAVGKWSGKFTVGGQSVASANSGMSFNVKSLLGTSGNHYTLSVEFTYKCNKTNYTNDGASHSSVGNVKNISVVVDYTPYTKCTAPTSVTVASDNVAPGAAVRLNWSGASGGTNNPISSYTVYRSEDNSAWSVLQSGITNTYLDVDAPEANNATYYYKVEAIGSVSGYDSTKSDATASLTCSFSAPSVSDVKIDNSTSNFYKLAGASATLSWSGTDGTNNPITKYEIYNGTTKLGETVENGYSVTAPSAGQSSVFSVKPIGTYSDGTAENSPTLYGYSATSAPTTVSISKTNVGPAEAVVLSWSGAAAGRYNDITGYRVMRATSENGTYSKLGEDILSTDASGSMYVTSPTGNGSSYFYKIITLGARANSARSAAASVKTVWSAPSVSALKLDGSTSAQYKTAGAAATLSWTGTAGTNNAITKYEVYEDGAKIGETTGASMQVTAHATAGQSHTYTVKPIGTLQDGSASSGITLYTYSAPATPVPAFANPTPDAGTSAVLSWPAAAAGQFNPVTGYRVFFCETSSGTYAQYGNDLAADTTSVTLTAPATMGVSHYYKVMALGQRSNSALSAAAQVMAQVYSLPASPSVTVDNATPDAGAQTTLRWSGAKAGTNNPISGYRVMRSSSANGTYTELAVVAANVSSLPITAPSTMGERYFYRVYTLGTKAGFAASEASETVSIMSQVYTRCTEPTSVTISKSLANPGDTITVSWSGANPGTNNPISGYAVYRTVNGGSYTLFDTVAGTANSINDTVGDSGTTYSYKITTLGTESGFDSLSSAAVSVKSNTKPGKIASFVQPAAIYEGGQISISWTAPEDADANIDHYSIQYRQQSGGSTWGEWGQLSITTACRFEDQPTVARGLKFQYRVCAVDTLSLSGDYAETQIFTKNSTPVTPRITRPSNGAVTLDKRPIFFLEIFDEPDGQTQYAYVSVDGGGYALSANVGSAARHVAIRCPVDVSIGSRHEISIRLQDSLGAASQAASITIQVNNNAWDREITTGTIISKIGPSFVGDSLRLSTDGIFTDDVLTLTNASFSGDVLVIEEDVGISHQSEIEEMYARTNIVRTYYGLSSISVPASVGDNYANAGSGKIGMFAAWGTQMRTLQQALTDIYHAISVDAPAWLNATDGMHPRADVLNQIRSTILNL